MNGFSTKSIECKKIEIGNLIKNNVCDLTWNCSSLVKLSIDSNKRQLTIHYSVNNLQHSAVFGLESMDRAIVSDIGHEWVLSFCINSLPKIWIKNLLLSSRYKDAWTRIAIYEQTEHDVLETERFKLQFAKCNFIRLHIDSVKVTSKAFCKFAKTLSLYNIMDYPFKTRNIKINTKPQDFRANLLSELDFRVYYMIECLISNNLIQRLNLTKSFIMKLLDCSVDTSVYILEEIYGQKQQKFSVETHFLARQKKLQNVQPRSLVGYSVLIPKVIVTPLKIYFRPPVLETSNRVIRQYWEHKDRFIRVSFTDETFFGIGWGSMENEKVYYRIKNILKNNIQIGNRKYEFLAFSSSQLRDTSCWFFCSTGTVTPDAIRKSLGNFKSIKTASKYAARLGQAFSSTVEPKGMLAHLTIKLPDIEINGYTFSDGVGMIPMHLIEAIAKDLNLDNVPSAIQFRMGGYKGVLSAWPDKSNFIKLRNSQMKFESTHSKLEIVKVACYSPCYLNRQIITLLSVLGVKDEAFEKLQNIMLVDLENLMSDKMVALKISKNYFGGQRHAKLMTDLIERDYMKLSDPYVLNSLEVLKIVLNKDLKFKSRIYVENGALLMGILDEIGVLKENELYVQVSSIKYQNIKVVIGKCLITRSPCYHPGDVRIVTAVDVPQLSHLKNCVVFPKVGKRDLPNQCSGGDLDGDFYTIIWEESLMPTIQDYPPMDYTPPPPKTLSDVAISDVKQFFIDYIKNDKLGLISNSHLATADLSPLGANDPRCLELAGLHSIAVDFAKSGVPAVLKQDLVPKSYPDFMINSNKRKYKSNKVIGRMYRNISTLNFKPLNTSNYDERLEVDGYLKYVTDATELKYLYDEEIGSLMRQYGIENEIEIVSGFILKHDPNIMKSSFEISISIKELFSRIRTKYRKKFANHFNSEEINEIDTNQRMVTYQFASAWYYVTYNSSIVYKSGHGFVSFPWIVGDILVQIIDSKFGCKNWNTKGQFRDVKVNIPEDDYSSDNGSEKTIELPDINDELDFDHLDSLFTRLLL